MTMLSGKVAILRVGAVAETRDLGPNPVAVKANALPLVEEHPTLADGDREVGPAYVIEAARVRAVYRLMTAPELAAEADAAKEATLNAFDALALKVLFDHENRIRALESKAAITAAQFRTALKARL